MPKVSTENPEAPTRAPRKRAVRRVVPKGDAPVRRTRTAASAPKEATPRKAPVRIVSNEPQQKKSKKKLYVVLTTVIFVAGTAAWIGVSDAGQIDVSARINENNERAAAAPQTDSQNNETDSQSIVVPVQDTPPVVEAVNLRGRGVGTSDVVQPVPEVVPEAATTTEATSTDATTESVEETSVEGDVSETPVE